MRLTSVIEKDASRALPVIFLCAQRILQTTFAYELVELRARNQENPLLLEQAEALDQRTGAKRPRTAEPRTRRKDHSAAAQWILRSTLPPELITTLAHSDDQHTPIVRWNGDGQLGGMGLLFLILSIVLVCGRRVDEGRLRSYLAQLSLSVDRALPSALQPFQSSTDASTPGPSQARPRTVEHKLTLESYMAQLQRYGYLEKARTDTVRSSDGTAPTPTAEYRWGPRAEVEIGEKAVGAFMVQMFAPVKQEAGVPDQEVLTAIERAAGTPLVG